MTKEEINAYFDGMLEGMWRYAWYKDGVQYVGSGINTYKEATAKAEAERERALQNAE